MATIQTESSGNRAYPEWAKMPKGYDFSTTGKDWSKYHKYFLLRTDAVWEKTKLKDFFRCFHKFFFFVGDEGKYYWTEPESIVTDILEAYNVGERMAPYLGFSNTGSMIDFQVDQRAKNPVAVTAQAHSVHIDFSELCAMRFETWHRCDMEHGHHYEKQIKMGKPRHNEEMIYPCFDVYYEAVSACNDDWFDFLSELHYWRKSNNMHLDDMWNKEIRSVPTAYDTPEHADERTYTY